MRLQSIMRVPSHVKLFKCQRCTACCTHKWRIEIDNASYDRLCDTFEQLDCTHELFDSVLFHNGGQQIRFLPNGRCPFLTDSDLCRLQLEFGATYLPNVCKIYPRRIFASQRGLEFALSLSCMTAVRTLAQGKIRLEELPPMNKDFTFICPHPIPQYHPEAMLAGDLRRCYHGLEDSLIELLQNQRYPLVERLSTLGKTLIQLLTITKSGQRIIATDITDSVSQALRSVDSNSTDLNLPMYLDQLCAIFNLYLSLTKTGDGPQILRSIVVSILSESSQSSLDAIAIVRSAINTPDETQYAKKIAIYYTPAQTTISPILENYLVNFVLAKHFFFAKPHIAYYKMTFAYAAIIFFALGYCSLTAQPIDQDILVQSICDVENIFFCNDTVMQKLETRLGQYDNLHIIKDAINLGSV